MTYIFNDRFIAYLVLICGLSVSSVAVYYSVVGLTAIFAAAVIPVIIMGTVLEISKLAATVWLKQYWHVAPKLIKIYLTAAVVVLMLITSMGIFGFLSKAHIEQTLGTAENSAEIQRVTQEIGRANSVITSNEQRIRQLESGGTGQDAALQSQIDREQSRIDAAMQRIEPLIQEQNSIIASRTRNSQDQIDSIDRDLSRLQQSLNLNQIAQVQSQIGVQADGQLGPRTQAAIREYRDRALAQKNQAVKNLESAQTDPVIDSARKEIVRIRSTTEQTVQQSTALINRLRDQLGRRQTSDVDQQIASLRAAAESANQDIDRLNQRRFQLESQVRKLEAEVGPVKYLAKLIYGDQADKDMLERAVTWVIMALIFVFDPLAVILLLSSQISFGWLMRSGQNDMTSPDIPHVFVADVGEKPTAEELAEINAEGVSSDSQDRPWTWPPKTPDDPKLWMAVPDSAVMSNAAVDLSGDLDESLEEKEATRIWKQLHPHLTLKDQRDKLAAGLISQLPWQDLITPLYVEQFGQDLPAQAHVGELFLLTNTRPTVLHKYTGQQWVKIDAHKKNYYALGSLYLEWLITELHDGKYHPDWLTESERSALAEKLQSSS